jgi:cysteinyl-tRNA synthetase
MPEVPDADIPGIRETINGREELRKQGRYGEADRIRDELSRTGIELVDHGSGTVWIKREHIAAEQAGTG